MPNAGPVGPKHVVSGLPRSVPALFRSTDVHIHRLKADFAGAGEAIPYELAGAGKQACRQPLKFRFHADRWVFVDPSAGLDVNSLARAERNFKDIAVTMQPENTVAVGSCKSVNEEARTTQKDVRDATHTSECEVDLIGRRQKLVLANIEALASLQVNREDMPDAIATEGDAAWTTGLRHEDWHTGEHPLECP